MTQQKNSRTKRALVAAFNKLVVSRPYSDFHVADIISVADVSRSTFYEHFRSKQDLLRECVQHLIDLLARVGFEDDVEVEHVTSLLAHFLDVREVSIVLLNSDVSRLVVQMLADAIAPKLAAVTVSVPPNLVAAQMAESTFGIIRAWLNDFSTVSPEAVAQQLLDSAKRLAAST